MNVLGKLQHLTLDLSRAWRRSKRDEDSKAITPEQTDQLDLLLAEVRENERALGSEHWSAMAGVFQSRLTEAQPQPRQSRYRYKASASHLLPLGGLFALGLTLSQVTHPIMTDEATLPTLQSPTTEVAASSPAGMASTTANTLAHSVTAPDVETDDAQRSSAPAEDGTEAVNRQSSHGSSRRSPQTNQLAQRKARDVAATSLSPASTEPTIAVETAPPPVATGTEAAAHVDTFAAQLSALKRADKALKAGRLSEAKAALNRDFSPQLEPHAKALSTILSCQSGAHESGRRSLDAQERRFPNSPYLERMRRACK